MCGCARVCELKTSKRDGKTQKNPPKKCRKPSHKLTHVTAAEAFAGTSWMPLKGVAVDTLMSACQQSGQHPAPVSQTALVKKVAP